jgi:hypothetical protein
MAYANVAIASPALPVFVLSEELLQGLENTIYQALENCLRNGRRSATPLTPSLAPAKPNSSTTLPPLSIIPLFDCPADEIDPPADETDSCVDSYSADEQPPSLQPDVTVPSVQPRLPSCCLLHVQRPPLVLSCAPCAPNTYIWCHWEVLVAGMGWALPRAFRDAG